MITFPSISKAGYAQDKLRNAGYFSTIGKSPAGLLQTCGYALYLDVSNINNLITYLDQSGIEYSGIYLMQQGEYKRVK